LVACGFGAQLSKLPKTKNGKSRHIPLNAVALAALKTLQNRSLNGDGPVFVNIQREVLRGYKHWFDPAVEESGLKDFTWYCLRHAFARRLAMAGVSLLTISELMGHKRIQLTKRYAHLAPAHNQAAVDRLVEFHAETAAASPTDTKTDTGPESYNDQRLAGVQ